jgi:pyridoxal phosphate-dependent aminotransferase EpsN
MKRIYLSPPHLDGRERELLLQAYESNWIATLGPHVDAFEQEMSEKIGVKHAAALASGTAALHLALLIIGVKQGDVVLCSNLTFVASINAITYVGATPIFIDSDHAT